MKHPQSARARLLQNGMPTLSGAFAFGDMSLSHQSRSLEEKEAAAFAAAFGNTRAGISQTLDDYPEDRRGCRYAVVRLVRAFRRNAATERRNENGFSAVRR